MVNYFNLPYRFVARLSKFLPRCIFGYKVVIYFKSGNKLTLRCISFSVTKSSGNIQSIEWALCSGQIMYIDLESIETIYMPSGI